MMGNLSQMQKNCNFPPSFQMNSVNYVNTSPYVNINNLNIMNDNYRRNSQIIQSNVVLKQNPLHSLTIENIKINSLEYQGIPSLVFSNPRI